VVEGVRRIGDDGLSHTIGVSQHICSANPQYPIPFLTQESRAGLVPLGPITSLMDLAIDLNDEPAGAAIEIRHVRIDWVLFAKGNALRRAAQALP
jgi:hypothetical protein